MMCGFSLPAFERGAQVTETALYEGQIAGGIGAPQAFQVLL